MPLYLVCIPPGDPNSSNLTDLLEPFESISIWENVYFVGAKVSANELATKLGVLPNGLGLVVPMELGSLSGRASMDAVEWIKARSGKSVA